MPVKNQSGIRQVYYVVGQRRVVEVDGEVPDSAAEADAGLRAALAPRAGPGPRRPGPPLKRLVEAANAPGTMVSVGAPRSPAAFRALLSARPSVRAERPDVLPGWLRWIASETAPAAAWELLARWRGYASAGGLPGLPGALVADMRAVLRGEVVPGLRRVLPVPETLPGVPLVVLCACDAPRWEVLAVRGVLEDPDAPVLDLVVLEDASAPAASAALRAALSAPDGLPPDAWADLPRGPLPAGSTVRYLRRSSRTGYTRNANEGGSLYDPGRHSCVVWLNGDTDPGPGWLRALLRALGSGPRVGFASPLSDNNITFNVPLLPGSTAAETADALLLVHDGSYPEVFLPSGFCLAVRGRVWEDHGPFDESKWGAGYGEETELECKAWDAGWRAALAPDAFVRHAGSRSFGEDVREAAVRRAVPAIRSAFPWFEREARSYAGRDPTRAPRDRASCVSRIPDPGRPSVAFLSRSLLLSGGNIAMFCAADALRRAGWDTRVLTFDAKDADLYDADAVPQLFDGEPDLRRSYAAEVAASGLLVSGSFATADAGERIALDGAVRHVLFEQDDERRFDHNRGDSARARIEAAWRDSDVIAVSSWVADAVAEVRGERPPVCRAGFDPLVWYPRPRAERDRVVLAALYRPETAHRGGDLLLAALRIVAQRRAPVDVVLFGSRPAPGTPSARYVGRLPHHRLSREVADADLLVDASPFQGFGLDAVQALACGTALVCLDNGGSAEYARDGENAAVLPRGSGAGDLADAICALAEDRLRLRALGASAPASVAGLAWPELVPEWDAALRAILPRI